MGPQVVHVILVGHESVNLRISGMSKDKADHHRQPIQADEIQTFKALITIHKVLQEGHPIVLKEAQSNVQWLESLARGAPGGDGMRGWRFKKESETEVLNTWAGYGPLIREYVQLLEAKLLFHRNHTAFNGKKTQLTDGASAE